MRTPLTDRERHRLFADVVMPYLDEAYALARWLTGNGTDAEDVVQEACVRALAGVDLYAGGNARAWFLTIVRHAAFTWLSKNRPKALVFPGDLEEAERHAAQEWDRTATPEATLIAEVDAAQLEAAIAALPLIYRETIVLRDIYGLSYREIADMMRTPIGTVMSRLARARALLIAAIGTNPS